VCRAAAEHYRRGHVHFVVVRNYQSFIPYAGVLVAERFERRSLPCVRALGSAPLLLVSTDIHLAGLLPEESARPILGPPADYPRLDLRTYAWANGPIAAVAVDQSVQERLVAAYRREADKALAAGIPGFEPGRRPTIADGVAATRARTRFPG